MTPIAQKFDIRPQKALILIPDRPEPLPPDSEFASDAWTLARIEDGSAVVCMADDDWQPIAPRGRIMVWFEGNLHDAVNLRRYAERLRCAADRLARDYGTIAKAHLPLDGFRVAGRFDLDRMVILEVGDADLLERWAGEPIGHIRPHALNTPVVGADKLERLLGDWDNLNAVCMRSDPDGPLVWRLMNGQILMREAPGKEITLWSVDDPEFREDKARLIGLEGAWDRIFGRDRLPSWARART